MKLAVGLGNPGDSYEATRHNVGFWVIDAFSVKYQVPLREKMGRSIIGRGQWPTATEQIAFALAKPETFMNRSGGAVAALLKILQVQLSDLILIYDDLDMECGRIRIRTQGSAGGHRGVASVIEAVGSDHFMRVKIGIGRNMGQDAADYVLSPFSKQERVYVQQSVERSVDALSMLFEGRVTEAMNRYHVPCD